MSLTTPLSFGILIAGLGLAAIAHAQQATVRAEAETRTVDCGGGDAEVGGNRNTLTFHGGCRDFLLRGDANTVTIELAPGARVDIEGNRNHIRYSVVGGGAPPTVRVSGSDTDLGPAGSGPPPAPAPLPCTAQRRQPAPRCRLHGRRCRHPGQSLRCTRSAAVAVRLWHTVTATRCAPSCSPARASRWRVTGRR